jgi:hypothetical protein
LAQKISRHGLICPESHHHVDYILAVENDHAQAQLIHCAPLQHLHQQLLKGTELFRHSLGEVFPVLSLEDEENPVKGLRVILLQRRRQFFDLQAHGFPLEDVGLTEIGYFISGVSFLGGDSPPPPLVLQNLLSIGDGSIPGGVDLFNQTLLQAQKGAIVHEVFENGYLYLRNHFGSVLKLPLQPVQKA